MSRERGGGDGPAGPPVPDLHATIVENLFDGVYYVDRNRTITYWNPAAERISGYSAAEVTGRRCFDNILNHIDEHGEPLCLKRCPLVESMAQLRGTEAEVYLHHREGHRVPVHVRCQPIRDQQGMVVGAVEIFNEDSGYREALRRIVELEHLSGSDALTGMCNRRTGELAIQSRLQQLRETSWPLSLLFVDVDRFKAVNDTHGHGVGDEVLGHVARGIRGTIRESDLVVRWGGDEFVVASAAATPAQLERVAERVRVMVAASEARLHELAVRATVSVGATLAHAGDSIETLVARADEAMYLSKAAGGNRVSLLARSA